MPFSEKSAWVMAGALAITSAGYAVLVGLASRAAGGLIPPLMPLLIVYTVVLATIAAASHIVLALFSPKEANARADERERLISLRAGNWSGYVFAAGVALALFFYLLVPSGDILFYAVFATWIIAQLSEYVVQIILYRSRV